MRPSLGPVYECLSRASPDEAKAHGNSLTQPGPVDFRTAQNTAGAVWPAHSLLSCSIDDSLGTISVILSILYGTDVITPGNPIFFLDIFFP